MVREKILQGQGEVRENLHFEQKSGKIEILIYTIEGWKKHVGSL